MTLTLMELVRKWRAETGKWYVTTPEVKRLGFCADELEALVREWDKKLATPTISPVRFVRRDVLGTVPKEPRT